MFLNKEIEKEFLENEIRCRRDNTVYGMYGQYAIKVNPELNIKYLETIIEDTTKLDLLIQIEKLELQNKELQIKNSHLQELLDNTNDQVIELQAKVFKLEEKVNHHKKIINTTFTKSLLEADPNDILNPYKLTCEGE